MRSTGHPISYAFLFSLVIIACSQMAYSEDTGKLPTVTYRDGVIIDSHLPYKKPFEITGPAYAFGQPVNMVHASILETDGHTPVSTQPWIRQKAEETEFVITVPALGTLGKNYKIELDFYTGVAHDSTTIGFLSAQIDDSLKHVGRGDITLDEVKQIVEYFVKLNVGQHIVGANLSYVFPTPGGGNQIQPQPSREINEHFKRLSNSYGTIFSLTRTIEQNSDNLAAKVSDLHDQQKVIDAMVAANPKDPNLPQAKRSLKFIEDEIAKKRAKQDSDKARLAKQEKLARDEMTIFLRDQYSRELVINTGYRYVWAGKAELERYRLGTVLGFGLAVHNITGHGINRSEVESAVYTGLKYRLGPVDPELPNPYLSGNSRWSFIFGVLVANDLGFQDQKFKPISGLMPVGGIALDIRPDINLTLGAVVYKQPSVNPLATDRTRTRMSLWLSLDMDADLVNRIGGIIKPKE